MHKGREIMFDVLLPQTIVLWTASKSSKAGDDESIDFRLLMTVSRD